MVRQGKYIAFKNCDTTLLKRYEAGEDVYSDSNIVTTLNLGNYSSNCSDAKEHIQLFCSKRLTDGTLKYDYMEIYGIDFGNNGWKSNTTVVPYIYKHKGNNKYKPVKKRRSVYLDNTFLDDHECGVVKHICGNKLKHNKNSKRIEVRNSAWSILAYHRIKHAYSIHSEYKFGDSNYHVFDFWNTGYPIWSVTKTYNR